VAVSKLEGKQRLSDAEKDHRALQDVFDEVATLASKRQHKMMRLLYVINDNEDVLKQRFGEYDTAVALNGMNGLMQYQLNSQCTSNGVLLIALKMESKNRSSHYPCPASAGSLNVLESLLALR